MLFPFQNQFAAIFGPRLCPIGCPKKLFCWILQYPLDYHLWTPHLTIFGVPKYTPQIPYLAYLGTYLSVPDMVKWGVPEKILQNAVQTRWPFVNRTPQSKVMTNLIFGWFPHCNYNIKLKSAGGFCLLIYKFKTFCGVFIHHLAALVQKNCKIKKKVFWDTLMQIDTFKRLQNALVCQ